MSNDGNADFLAQRFEAERPRLRSVAYRMLGSLAEADDAVQESWIRLSRSDADEIDNLRAWLTTVVGRVCLNMLRSRRTRREEPLDAHMPDPILRPAPDVTVSSPEASLAPSADPEQAAVMADSVGLALLVVLDTLEPPERLAFVLHDMFGMPYEEIAPLVGRSVDAARQLASRARRRVQGDGRAVPAAGSSARQREVVEAFMAASRLGEFDALLNVLDPDVRLRVDFGPNHPAKVVRGAVEVARNATMYSHAAAYSHLALINGEYGVVAVKSGRVMSVLALTVVGDRVAEMNILADPARLRHLDASALVA